MLTKFSKCCAVKLFAVVHCDFSRYAKAAYDVLPEIFLQSGGCDVAKSFGFDPLRKVLYNDCCIFEVAWSCWQGFYNINSLSREGPDWGYEVDFFWRELVVMGVLLTIWARMYDFMGIRHSRRPIKTFAESFSHQGSCSNVRRAHSSVYFLQQLSAFGL